MGCLTSGSVECIVGLGSKQSLNTGKPSEKWLFSSLGVGRRAAIQNPIAGENSGAECLRLFKRPMPQASGGVANKLIAASTGEFTLTGNFTRTGITLLKERHALYPKPRNSSDRHGRPRQRWWGNTPANPRDHYIRPNKPRGAMYCTRYSDRGTSTPQHSLVFPPVREVA